MKVSIAVILCIVCFLIGGSITFFVYRYCEEKSLEQLASKSTVVLEEIDETASFLEDINRIQAEKILEMHNVLVRISDTVNSEVSNLTQALNIIRTLKEIVRENL